MKKYQPLLLSVFSGLLFFLAWPTFNFTIAIFFAFIPLLIIERMQLPRLQLYALSYLTFFIWNVTTTWWIWNSTALGAIMAIVVNSLLMCIPFLSFSYVRKKWGALLGYSSLIIFWLSFEYIHLQDWGLSWPWLTLGNVFASKIQWVQWYEFTGTSGGSLWILLLNVLFFDLFVRSQLFKGWQRWKKAGTTFLSITIPLLLSSITVNKWTKYSATTLLPANIAIVQPNIDPYEKVAVGTFDVQLQKLIRLSESIVDSNTTLLIWPETALYSPNGFDEANLKENYFLLPLFDFLKRHPQLQLFTGVESYRIFNQKNSNVTRPIEGTSNFYEVYNGSVLLDSSGARQFYHKSMLVPGVETLPRFLLFLGPVFEKFGGTAGGYAGQKERTPVSTKNKFIIAPAICYESIYGEFMTGYMKKDANLIAIITNDGWWGNTPGHKHHQLYARLRAIETRTWVARSANTGISCFIDPTGKVLKPQPWWKEGALKIHIQPLNQKTFFVQNGDLISKLALGFLVVILLFLLFKKLSSFRSTRQNQQ